MAGIGQCDSNTDLRNEITAAYIYMIPKKTLGIKRPRNTIETSGFKCMSDGAYTLNHDLALCIIL